MLHRNGLQVKLEDDNQVIAVRNIMKSFGTVHALRNITLSVNKGIFGLIGPNGAGKTTLLKILLGLLRQNGGTAKILGLDASRDSLKLRRKIGVLHEKPVYPKSMTPSRYLRYVRGFYGSTRSIAEILTLVSLQEAKDRRVGKLSAGMLQRLGIAQALIGNPELVLMDEPTANLDVIGRCEITQLIVDLHNETGVSFFITSHILSELEKLCHDIAIIRSGQIISKGALPDIIENLTIGLYRIINSNPRALLYGIQSLRYLKSVEISGANSLTMKLQPHLLSKAEKDVQTVAIELGIHVYGIERADSLEDAFREAIANE